MEELIQQMKVLLASNFSLYLKAHNFHWNVEGPDFAQYHAFFSSFYEEIFDANDTIAEHIRALNAYAPGSYSRFAALSQIQDEVNIPTAMEMIRRLYNDNQSIINLLEGTYVLAEQANEIGLSNFIQDRVDIHKKHAWMLRSFIK